MNVTASTQAQPMTKTQAAQWDNQPLDAGYGVKVTYHTQKDAKGVGANITHNGQPPIRLQWYSDGTLNVTDLGGKPVSQQRAMDCLQALKNLRQDCISKGQLKHAPGTTNSPPNEAEFRRWAQFNATINRLEMLVNMTGKGKNVPADPTAATLDEPLSLLVLPKSQSDPVAVSFDVA